MRKRANRILVRYHGTSLFNYPLSFFWWLLVSYAAGITCYLYCMFVIDGIIKSDNKNTVTDPEAEYGNIVERAIREIPFLGSKLYP